MVSKRLNAAKAVLKLNQFQQKLNAIDLDFFLIKNL